jgi:hypothetical protein
MTLLDNLTLRDLQKESARALSVIQSSNENIWQFNKQACHDSQHWYKTVIKWYIDQYGDLPSKIGPGTKIKLFNDV